MKQKIVKLNASNLNTNRLTALQAFIDLNILSDKVVLAGGALRTVLRKETDIVDYDLFFVGDNTSEQVKDHLVSKGFTVIFKCPLNLLTTLYKDGMKIQLITKTIFTSKDQIFEDFDFTCTLAVFDGTTLLLDRCFIRDVKKKLLNINNLYYPVATLNRIAKYKNKGYWTSDQMYIDIINKIMFENYKFRDMALYID